MSRHAQLVVRTLLIADAALIVLVGFGFLFFVDGTAGPVVGGGAFLVAGGLLGCLPLTNPYRAERKESGWDW